MACWDLGLPAMINGGLGEVLGHLWIVLHLTEMEWGGGGGGCMRIVEITFEL